MWNETFLNSEKRKENGSKMEIRLSLVSLSWAVYLLEAGIYFCLMFLSYFSHSLGGPNELGDNGWQ